MFAWLRTAFQRLQRAFVLGPAVVERADELWGRDTEQFTPEAYGNYIAISNGVYTCATIRASLLSSLPLRLYRLRRGGRREEITRGELYDLLQKVNPFWSFKRLLEMTELSLCLWGTAYWFLERGPTGQGRPREIWWARPDRVTVHPDAQRYLSHYTYRPAGGGPEIRFEPDEVVRFFYPNPMDEFAGLSPLAAARLAADYASAALKANLKLHEQGMQLGGYLAPPPQGTFTEEQARELELALDRRFRGVDKAHRWGVFRFDAQVKQLTLSPRDAEFLAGLRWSLEDICRAYHVPLDLVGGQRTYENMDAAYRAVWTNCIVPEAERIAADITEQLLPHFADADLVEFDTSDIAVLQEAETERWSRAKEQIELGAMTINEWRAQQGLEPLPWGGVWWAPLTVAPIRQSGGEQEAEGAEAGAERSVVARAPGPAVVFGSEAHRALWQRHVRRAQRYEERLSRVIVDLFRRQQDSVLNRLEHYGPAVVAEEPFVQAQWIRTFRETIRPALRDIIADAGAEALDDLVEGRALRQAPPEFDPDTPAAIRFLEGRAQRFAVRVNETTWQALKASLIEGLLANENISELSSRVKEVMGDRIRSTPETIARTEVNGAQNGGTLLAWEQSGQVASKVWIAALDERTRETHLAAHGQVVPLTADFQVGAGMGPHPGAIGLPEEDINCRCTMIADLTRAITIRGGNGYAGEHEHGDLHTRLPRG